MGEYKRGYTSFEFGVSRHWKSAGGRGSLWGRRPGQLNVEKGQTRYTRIVRNVNQGSCQDSLQGVCRGRPLDES